MLFHRETGARLESYSSSIFFLQTNGVDTLLFAVCFQKQVGFPRRSLTCAAFLLQSARKFNHFKLKIENNNNNNDSEMESESVWQRVTGDCWWGELLRVPSLPSPKKDMNKNKKNGSFRQNLQHLHAQYRFFFSPLKRWDPGVCRRVAAWAERKGGEPRGQGLFPDPALHETVPVPSELRRCSRLHCASPESAIK